MPDDQKPDTSEQNPNTSENQPHPALDVDETLKAASVLLKGGAGWLGKKLLKASDKAKETVNNARVDKVLDEENQDSGIVEKAVDASARGANWLGGKLVEMTESNPTEGENQPQNTPNTNEALKTLGTAGLIGAAWLGKKLVERAVSAKNETPTTSTASESPHNAEHIEESDYASAFVGKFEVGSFHDLSYGSQSSSFSSYLTREYLKDGRFFQYGGGYISGHDTQTHESSSFFSKDAHNNYKKAPPKQRGQWSVQGNVLTLTWDDHRTEKFEFRFSDDRKMYQLKPVGASDKSYKNAWSRIK